jgi:rfaE bifunctional protein nucleotidyltransferase chain/domain
MKTIFTNGCFDMIHAGHVRLLVHAKSLGDKLVVGINSDESVRRIKGPGRPYQSQEDRKFVLEQFAFVDEVIIFKEDTEYKTLERLMPDVTVKGSEWKGILDVPEGIDIEYYDIGCVISKLSSSAYINDKKRN